MTSITSEDLKPFTNLYLLFLGSNKLAKLDGNLMQNVGLELFNDRKDL